MRKEEIEMLLDENDRKRDMRIANAPLCVCLGALATELALIMTIAMSYYCSDIIWPVVLSAVLLTILGWIPSAITIHSLRALDKEEDELDEAWEEADETDEADEENATE